jgi:hypothetical protein
MGPTTQMPMLSDLHEESLLLYSSWMLQNCTLYSLEAQLLDRATHGHVGVQANTTNSTKQGSASLSHDHVQRSHVAFAWVLELANKRPYLHAPSN